MQLEAIYHRPKGHFAYAYDEKTLHIQLRVAGQRIRALALQTVAKRLRMQRNLKSYWFGKIKREASL